MPPNTTPPSAASSRSTPKTTRPKDALWWFQPAYVAYKASEGMPTALRTKTLEIVNGDEVRPHMGELFCRFPVVRCSEIVCCGRKFTAHATLRGHITRTHRTPDGGKLRVIAGNGGAPDQQAMEEASAFYQLAMHKPKRPYGPRGATAAASASSASASPASN